MPRRSPGAAPRRRRQAIRRRRQAIRRRRQAIRRRLARADGGFSLVELLVVMALSAVIGTAVATVVAATARTQRFAVEHGEELDQSRIALDRVRQELREARRVEALSDATTLAFWVDQDQDQLQDAAEQVTWSLMTSGSETSLRRSTVAAPTPITVARGLLADSAFTYDATPPATRVVTIRINADPGSHDGSVEAVGEVRLRNAV